MKREYLKSAADQTLVAACQEAEELTSAQFGGRVWMLPPWYLVALHRENRILLSYSELTLRLFDWPRMLLLAKVYGPLGHSSHITWTIKKGLVGRLTFDLPDFEVLHHHAFWPDNLDTMTPTEWNRVDASIRLGRSLAEAQSLKRLYGTVVGVPIADPQSGAKLGCITLHTASSQPLSQDQADVLAARLLAKTGELARQIVRRARLTAKLASDPA